MRNSTTFDGPRVLFSVVVRLGENADRSVAAEVAGVDDELGRFGNRGGGVVSGDMDADQRIPSMTE